MTIGDGIAVGLGSWAFVSFFAVLAWNNIQIAKIKLDAAKNGLGTKAE